MSNLPDVSLEAFNARAGAFLGLHQNRPTPPFIANLQTTVDVVRAGSALLPVTVNEQEAGNAWICSPHTTYCSYAREEVARMGHPWLARPLTGLTGIVGSWLRRCDIDRAVFINNWLVTTNCYPRLADVDMDAAIEEARCRWPGHALWFRSLNAVHHRDWLRALVERGGVLLPSRQVYLFEDIPALSRHANFRRDAALLRDAGRLRCEPVPDHAEDFARAEALYADLYLRKYSRFNPAYGQDLLRAWSRAGLLRLHGLRDPDGVLQGVVGLFGFGNLTTAPIVGYNTGLPQSLGLYRRLMACVMREAAMQRQMVNLSAGAAHFKRLRGGVPATEYSVVLVDHVSRRTRHAIRALGRVARGVGVPLMKRYRL